MKMNKSSIFLRSLSILAKPVPAFFFAFIFYFVFSTQAGSPFRVSEYAYFNYLADAFLHGQLNLRLLPASVHDLSFFQGKYYLYWPPMPAIVLMPFVALFGVHFSDVFFGVVLGAINVAMVAILLREVDRAKLIELDEEYRAWLVVFFALGTVQVVLASFGTVWFTAQLLGFLFVALAYFSALKFEGMKAFVWVGVFMACAMVTRNHLIFTGIWPAYYLLSKHWQARPKLFAWAGLALLPALLFGTVFLLYNHLRFGSPLELGIKYHDMASIFVSDFKKYGAFNLHYLPINFYYQYIYYPLPITVETVMGGSLFLLSPVFLYAFRALWGGHRNPLVIAWTLSILATSVPILLLMGTGWEQYGPRYTLDFTVPLLMLTAYGVQGVSKNWLGLFTALSIFQYIPGVQLFALLQRLPR
jgi:hypothetical protein